MANNTGLWVTLGLAAAAGVGGLIYYESKKTIGGGAADICIASGGTWNVGTKTCICPSGYTLDPTSGKCIISSPTAPTPPATVTVSGQTATGPNAWTANINWTAVSGATSYKILVDGQQVGTAPAGATSGTIHGTNPGANHSAAVAACN